MIKLNVGNLFDEEYLAEVIRLNEEYKDKIQVRSLFGSVKGLTPTARAQDRIPYMEWGKLDRYVDKAKRHGIETRYTLNQSCIGALQDFGTGWHAKLREDLNELHAIGVWEWTVTSSLLVELLRDMFPDDFIEVSTIAELTTAEEVKRWMDIGANGVNISTSINRSFMAIKALVNTGITVSVLANEACLYRCPWRRDCYNLSSHDSSRSEELFSFYPFRRCNEYRMKHPVEWVKSRMVLPQWMKTYQYEIGVDCFKIAYRTHPKEVAVPILKAYMSQEYKGNLLDLWPTIAHLGQTGEPKDNTNIPCSELDRLDFLDYFKRVGDVCHLLTCGKSCNYCYTVFKKARAKE